MRFVETRSSGPVAQSGADVAPGEHVFFSCQPAICSRRSTGSVSSKAVMAAGRMRGLVGRDQT